MFRGPKATLSRFAKINGQAGSTEWALLAREVHPPVGLRVVLAMGPTLAALIMMTESGGSAFVG